MVERPSPEAISPSVVAVLVTHDPGAWFDGTLAALAAQDHPVLHVLVIDAGSTVDPTGRVHAALPHASVVRVGASPGFGAAANDVLELAPDADWFLFCHDDAAPESGAVRKLVTTAERWQAGVVGPKLVRWNDPRRLLQVGEAVDKTGATMSMVDRDELDQGQHDGLREVFSVPGAFTLVRSDLFLRIGGFDEVVAFHGENLSLCWRARIAGARVVVTTDVRVRHREGLRQRLPSGLRRRLAARNRLRIMLTCYGRWHLLRVLPQAALASLVEVGSSLATGRPTQARAAAGAWWWNLRQLRSLRAARSQVRHFRNVDDTTVRRLQVPGLLRPQLVMHRLAARQDATDDLAYRLPAAVPTALGGSAWAEPGSISDVGAAPRPARAATAMAAEGAGDVDAAGHAVTAGAVGAGGGADDVRHSGTATAGADGEGGQAAHRATLAGARGGDARAEPVSISDPGAAPELAGTASATTAASAGGLELTGQPAGDTALAGGTEAAGAAGDRGGAAGMGRPRAVAEGAGSGAIEGIGGADEADGAAGRLRRGWTSGAAIVLLLLAGALLLGSRHLITRGVPVIGDLAPIDAPGRLLAEWSGGWRRAGLGSSAPAPTAFGLLSGLGALAAGHMALLRLLLTVGLIPVGVLGAFRLLRPSGSYRAAAGAAVAYAVLPLPYGALATGRWEPLAAYAAAPWLLAGLARAGTMAPLGLRPRPRHAEAAADVEAEVEAEAEATEIEIDLRSGAGAAGAGAGAATPAGVASVTPPAPVLRAALGLGIVTALLAMLVPAAPVVLLVMATALVLGAVLAFEARGVLRAARAAVGGALVALALHLPWSWDLLRSWRTIGWSGAAGGSAGAVDPLDVLRRGAGMSGSGALAWALLPAAAAVLLVGRDWRLAWAIRGWALALVAWAAAWASWHRTLDLPWPSPDVLLTLGGLGLAVAVGSSVAAVEVDVVGRGRRLGLRRLVTAVGAVAFFVAGLPLVESSFDGYWQMPRGDYSRVLGFVDDDVATLASRVLWIGDPDVLPVSGWPLEHAAGMVYATSDGLPEVHDLWPGRRDAATARIGEAVDLALDQQTTRLGRLLAPMAVQYLIVPQRLAPSPFTSVEQPAAPELVSTLGGQLDLERVDLDTAVVIYRNTAFVPGRAVVDDPDLLAASGPDDLRTLDLADEVRPALADRDDDGAATGELDDDVTLYQSTAGSSRWVLDVDGRRVSPRPAFGWANAFTVGEGGRAELRYETPLARRIVLALQVVLWVAALWLLLRLRRRPARPTRPTPTVPASTGPGSDHDAEPAGAIAATAGAGTRSPATPPVMANAGSFRVRDVSPERDIPYTEQPGPGSEGTA